MNTTVACFENRASAEEAGKYLSENKIEFKVSAEARENLPEEVFVLKVPRNHIEETLELFNAYYSEKKSPEGIVVCPSCGSSYVEFPALPRQAVMTYLVERAAEIVHAKEKTFYCRKCNYTWS